MTRAFLLFVLWMPMAMAAQDYRLFSFGMRRAFADPTGQSRMYSLSLDSLQVSGEDTTLYNFLLLNDTLGAYPGCGYLGGPDCLETTTPSWIGRSIAPLPNGASLRTAFGDTLNVMLPQSASDTLWFYASPNQRFGVRYLAADTSTFLSLADSARFYRIVHVDASGASISSALHEAPITIGKSFGLAEFFQVDSFPVVLRRLRAIGDANLQLGLHCITSATIHDYQVGDEVQYRQSSYSVFPEVLTWQIWKSEVLARSETDSTVVYSMLRTQFGHPNVATATYFTTETYSKRDTFAVIPFESFEGMHRTMVQRDRCGMLHWSYEFDPDNLAWPCPFGPCWTPWVNGTGPNPDSQSSHLLGLGSTSLFSQQFIQQWPGQQPVYVSNLKYILYSRKNGIPCGTEQHVGIEEQQTDHSLSIFPVPSTGRFKIESDKCMYRTEVLDQQGRNIAVMVDSAGSFDLGNAPDGFYFVQIYFADGSRNVRKVMVLH